ncbi:hypothetical protein SAY86_021924 [Trapa natans]|uniref:Uncharacterized protein n=1 Tax=Trapa natans TaxID=22666 RepID=A0AAN7RF48_TRANT|nr:hypothetical protein SAY86_021924 [Trapa natans]
MYTLAHSLHRGFFSTARPPLSVFVFVSSSSIQAYKPLLFPRSKINNGGSPDGIAAITTANLLRLHDVTGAGARRSGHRPVRGKGALHPRGLQDGNTQLRRSPSKIRRHLARPERAPAEAVLHRGRLLEGTSFSKMSCVEEEDPWMDQKDGFCLLR